MQTNVLSTPEDWRAASNMAVSLSEYLITVSISIVAGQAALAAGILSKIVRPTAYLVVSVLSSILLVLSSIYGGWAIASVYKSGFDGIWKNNVDAAHKFNVQAELLLLGFVTVVVSVGLALIPKKVAENAAPNEGERLRRETRAYLVVTSALFFAVGLMHVLRLLFGWSFAFNGWEVPRWLSVIALILTLVIVVCALNLRKRSH